MGVDHTELKVVMRRQVEGFISEISPTVCPQFHCMTEPKYPQAQMDPTLHCHKNYPPTECTFSVGTTYVHVVLFPGYVVCNSNRIHVRKSTMFYIVKIVLS